MVRTYQYDSAGNVVQETWYANGTDADQQQNPLNAICYAYDAAGNMLSEIDDASAVVYSYNAAGQVASVSEASDLLPTVVFVYAYNDAGLCSSTMQSGVGGPVVTLAYQNYASGNRT